MSRTLIRYILTAAARDRVFIGILVVFALCAALSLFFGSAAFVEKEQFSAVFTGYSLRLCGVAGLILFTVFFIRRSAEARDVEFLLTRPVSRVSLVLSYGAGLTLLALLLGAISGLILVLAAGKGGFHSGLLLWTLSIMGENMIMVNVALFFALSMGGAAGAAIAVFGLYVLARMSGSLLVIIDSGSQGPVFQVMEGAMQVISAVMPRLDLMGQSAWLVYGGAGGETLPMAMAMNAGSALALIAAQALAFSALALLAAILDLSHRQF